METYETQSFQTGSAPASATAREREVTRKEKVEIWFIDPLSKLKGDDGFVCLLICFPLIEAIIRYELDVPDKDDVPFSDESPALRWFAKFMQIPEGKSRDVWDALRNGLLHRGMLKTKINYTITGEKSDRPAEFKEDRLYLYVWTLRDDVVGLLKKQHKRLWADTGCPLPKITVVT